MDSTGVRDWQMFYIVRLDVGNFIVIDDEFEGVASVVGRG